MAGGLVRQRVLTYLQDSNPSYASKNIVNRVTNAQVRNSSGTKIAETIAVYDSTPLTAVTGITHHDAFNFGVGYTLRGNPTSLQPWTGSGSLTTTRNFDTTGQVTSASDPKGNVTQYGYANNFYVDNGANPPAPVSPAPPPANAHATQVTLPLSGTLSAAYYYGSSRRAFVTDQNGRTSYFHFQDLLDRPTKTLLPGGGWRETQYPTATRRKYVVALSATTTRQDQLDLDSWVRSDLGSLLTDPQGTSVVDTAYDTSGRVQNVSNPYRSPSDPTYGTNSYEYDGLNRKTRVTYADGNFRETFYGSAVPGAGGIAAQWCSPASYGLGFPTLFKDEAGKKRQTWADAFDRVIEVDEAEASGALTLATCYKYDLLDNQIQVEQGSQTRTAVFDALSRLTSETMPEAGTANYFYTTVAGALCSGNLQSPCRRTDARGITITFTYDAADRLTSKSFSNGDPTVNYFYDQTSYNGLTIANGRGRRTGMSDGSGQTAWSYDAEGHVLSERRTIAGVTKILSYTYTLDGSVASIAYPSGMVVNHTYSTAGRLTRLACNAASCWQTYFASNATYAPHGTLASLILGYNWYYGIPGGITTTYTYNKRFQPARIQAAHTNGTVSVLDLSYSFLAGTINDGLVKSITNNRVTGRSQTFTYDELNRLKTAQSQANSGADCWGQNYTYDRYGNLLEAAVTKCTAPALSLSVDGNNHITNSGFGYDVAGNLTSDGFSTYAWNGAGRLASTAGVTYTYDGDSRRVKKSAGTDGRLYWHGLRGEVLAESDLNGNILVEYIYFAGKLIAGRVPSSGAISYTVPDHLGSVRLIADATGTVLEESDFLPFGTERVITDTLDNPYKFAGYRRDTESGLDFAVSRQYASTLGRFLSPDCGPPVPGNPQSWNRYAYSWNNPTNLNDPLGTLPSSVVSDEPVGGCVPDPNAGGDDFFDASSPCPTGYIWVGFGGWANSESYLQQIAAAFEPLAGIIEDWEYANEYGTLFNVTISRDVFLQLLRSDFVAIGPGGVLIILGGPVSWTVVGGSIILAGITLYAVYQLSQALERAQVVPRDPVIEAKCREGLDDCLENPYQPDWNKPDYGNRKSCGECFGRCLAEGGNWPSEMCPE